MPVEYVDVVVVGAGLSGIGAGYRLQTECPDKSYAILEMRDTLGGTWDLFRYPGIRSDSDMFTLSYQFKPWRDPKAIADGGAILSYLHETVTEFGIDKHIRYGVKVVGADFDTATSLWTLDLDDRGESRTIRCRILYSCAGYYDYAQGHAPQWEGMESFEGELIYPQFWPEDLGYQGKRVVVIGSGATAVTIVPAMADSGAAHVTMLQRSPTWIASVPGEDKLANALRVGLPAAVAHQLVRTKNIWFNVGVYNFCQRFPRQARKLFTTLSAKQLDDAELVAAHLTPSYDPWDQRLCAVPDGDFFRVIRDGGASMVTSTIDRFEKDGIRLANGEFLPADIVVSATGLKLQFFGGVIPTVDGTPTKLNDQFVWNGAMVTSLPNFAVCIGYTNSSWTLRADLTHRLLCKVINEMDERGARSVVPRAEPGMSERPMLDLSSGYVQRAVGELPRQGDRGPWRVHQNYPLDASLTLRRSLNKSLAFS